MDRPRISSSARPRAYGFDRFWEISSNRRDPEERVSDDDGNGGGGGGRGTTGQEPLRFNVSLLLLLLLLGSLRLRGEDQRCRRDGPQSLPREPWRETTRTLPCAHPTSPFLSLHGSVYVYGYTRVHVYVYTHMASTYVASRNWRIILDG